MPAGSSGRHSLVLDSRRRTRVFMLSTRGARLPTGMRSSVSVSAQASSGILLIRSLKIPPLQTLSIAARLMPI